MQFPSKKSDSAEVSLWDSLIDECRTELETSRRELEETKLMIDQSQMEVAKLQQRNATVTAQLTQFQTQIESGSEADIRIAYNSALEAQQRLFVMRGQLEKLHSDQTHLERYSQLLNRVIEAIEAGNPQEASQRGVHAMTQTLEMLIQAQESERQRLARQMHDGPAQALSNFILQAEIAMRYFDIDQVKAKEELANVKSAASSTFQKVRSFIFELRPMMLDDLGLNPTLSRFVDMYKEQTGIDVRYINSGTEQRLESYLEVMIFRAIQEMLNNVSHHSQATQVTVQVDISHTDVRVNVEDNGKGFDLETLDDTNGMGLKVIRDRVEMLGGELQIHSVIGQGTNITFQIPAA